MQVTRDWLNSITWSLAYHLPNMLHVQRVEGSKTIDMQVEATKFDQPLSP